MTTWLELAPAYGRDYPNAKSVREAWKRGDDFHIMTPGWGSYASSRDFPAGGDVKVTLRYASLTKVVVP